ncbi:hypothetical protein CLIB1423_03S00496 [[Candida] railenensis]|uniref:Transmembrane protein n=1 Tax=[Candida] railenensis TaxID=45579 RepID=A0A9P0QL64_9ASCO|nr:hypothetical protein CLIB1423_03S00496 [[Candida] railenensis]
MKNFQLILLTTFSLNVAARLYNYTFSAHAVEENALIDDLYLQAALESDDTLYFFLGPKSDAVTISCDASGYTCYVLYNDQYFTLGQNDNDFIVASKRGGYQDYARVYVNSSLGYLDVYGTYFYALQNADDPISYSDDHFVIVNSVDTDSTFAYELRLLLEQATSDVIDAQRVFNPTNITMSGEVGAVKEDYHSSINYFFYSYTEEGGSPVETLYLQATLESEDTLYFFLGQRSQAITFSCDHFGRRCYVDIEGELFYLGVDDKYFIVARKEELKNDSNATIDVGSSLQSIYIDGYDFHASNTVEDPLLFSKQRPVLLSGNFTSDTQLYNFRLQSQKVSSYATDYQIFNNPEAIPLHNQTISSASRVSAYLTQSATNSRATRTSGYSFASAKRTSAAYSYTYTGYSYSTSRSSSNSGSGISKSTKIGIIIGVLGFWVLCVVVAFSIRSVLNKRKDKLLEEDKDSLPPYTP